MNNSLDSDLDLSPDLSPDVILNAYAEGKENSAFHLDCSNRLADQGNHYVTLRFAGGGGSIAYAVHLFGSTQLAAGWGLLAAGVHLFVVGAILAAVCLRPAPYWPPVNEGINLLIPKLQWHQILRGEIERIAMSTNEVRERNDARGAALRRGAVAALCSPITFLCVWLVAGCWLV